MELYVAECAKNAESIKKILDYMAGNADLNKLRVLDVQIVPCVHTVILLMKCEDRNGVR